MFKGLFDACKKTDPGTIYNDGLSIEEVMQRPCVEFLTTVLGLDEDQIENDFKRVDTDGNSRVTLQEGRGKMPIACPLKMRLLVPNSKFLLVESSPKAPLKLLRI